MTASNFWNGCFVQILHRSDMAREDNPRRSSPILAEDYLRGEADSRGEDDMSSSPRNPRYIEASKNVTVSRTRMGNDSGFEDEDDLALALPCLALPCDPRYL